MNVAAHGPDHESAERSAATHLNTATTHVPETTTPSTEPAPSDAGDAPEVDLDSIERDLDGVQAALGRLDDGTYWTDEVTGEPIPDDVLAADPVARRTSTGPASP